LQPERIDPKNFGRGYDVRSDVWSLGITLVCSIICWFQIFNSFFVYGLWCLYTITICELSSLKLHYCYYDICLTAFFPGQPGKLAPER